MTNPPARSLPASLRATPMLNRWLGVSGEGHIVLTPGKVEIGQGILTVLVQLCADELDVNPHRVRLQPAGTEHSPNEGVTSGSLSVQDCGMSVRHVAAQTRQVFLAEAARQLGVSVDELSVEDGIICGPGNLSTSYWELAPQIDLARPVDPEVAPKAVESRRLTGRSLPRVDVAGKAFGTRPYIHDIVLPDMLHGRVLRAPRPGAKLAALGEFDCTGTRLVRDGSFVGVICESEAAADAALRRLEAAASWAGGYDMPDAHDLAGWLKRQPAETSLVAERNASDPEPLVSLRRSYFKPYLAHASIAPSCAIAQWSDETLHVISHTQGIFNLRSDLAIVFGTAEEKISVQHAESAGCYGHNGADDVALDAALLARAVPGNPVRVRWSRADELAASPLGAAMTIDVGAQVSAAGDIQYWHHEIWSNGYVARPGRGDTPALLAAFDLAQPFPLYIAQDPPLAGGGGAQRNAVPLYDFPSWRIVKHRLLTMPLRTSSIRALGAFGNIFAIESFLDELATELDQDPLALRLRYLADERARAVLQRVATMADWGKAAIPDGHGRGLAFARYKNSSAYCAVVAEVDVNEEPRARRLWIAVDVGETINPDGVINQIEGGAIQATSWSLKEQVAYDEEGVTSRSWESYPILRFSEVPAVSVEIIDRPELPAVGAGEAAQGPVAAALANAIYNALGVRVRKLPLTRDHIIEAME
ncbi:MAG: oxidoreductase [Rhizobiales bacterium 62-17]|nr:xanthine dehydrogenase family protein molybdopterin-binding subunit [Hyphomicrobiales bacterium]OJY01594.1 MAG: oxidoreductase [Rhizobiales bacterium 62-17]